MKHPIHAVKGGTFPAKGTLNELLKLQDQFFQIMRSRLGDERCAIVIARKIHFKVPCYPAH